MFRPVTYQTTKLLAQGYPPWLLAHLDGVTKRAIHLRRQRFEQQTGGTSVGRFGKRGRPAPGQTRKEVLAKLERLQREGNQFVESRRRVDAGLDDEDCVG